MENSTVMCAIRAVWINCGMTLETITFNHRGKLELRRTYWHKYSLSNRSQWPGYSLYGTGCTMYKFPQSWEKEVQSGSCLFRQYGVVQPWQWEDGKPKFVPCSTHQTMPLVQLSICPEHGTMWGNGSPGQRHIQCPLKECCEYLISNFSLLASFLKTDFQTGKQSLPAQTKSPQTLALT